MTVKFPQRRHVKRILSLQSDRGPTQFEYRGRGYLEICLEWVSSHLYSVQSQEVKLCGAQYFDGEFDKILQVFFSMKVSPRVDHY